MGFLRLFPTRDAFITNKITSNGSRASGSNLGANPTLQVFKLTSSYPSQAPELARSLIQFDIASLSGAVFVEQTVASGSSFFLKLANYVVGDTTPTSFDIEAWPLSASWDQGIGQDDKTFTDYGYVNWNSATSTSAWLSGGGDYHRAYGSASQHFDVGTEDFEVDVTTIVRNWLSGGLQNNGFLLKLSNACETNTEDYWRKVFYAQETVTVASMPYLEARWEDSVKDNRGNFAYGQPSNLMMYNLVRGALQNVSSSNVTVRIQDNIIAASCSFSAAFSASRLETGVYYATFNVQNTGSVRFSSSWNDIWQDTSGNLLMSGVFAPLVLTGATTDPYYDFTVNPDHKRIYRSDEIARIKCPVFIDRHNDFVASHTASYAAPVQYMENMHFSVIDNTTNEIVIPFATSSVQYTRTSYNREGNYFNLAMNSLVPGFTYRFAFLIQHNKYDKTVLDQKFVFKVQ